MLLLEVDPVVVGTSQKHTPRIVSNSHRFVVSAM